MLSRTVAISQRQTSISFAPECSPRNHSLQTVMHIRTALPAFLFLVPVVSNASVGMIYGAVYECEADAINRVMVEACSSRFPELAKEADEALAAWRARNSAKAYAAAKACSIDAISAGGNASASDLATFRRLIADKKAEMFSSFDAKIRKQGASACHEALRQLQTVGGPLEIR